MPVDLVLVRHGQTVLNRQQRVQGRSDSPLDETGRAQANLLASSLARIPVRAVFSSPLRRATETANAIAARHGIDVQMEEGLIEMDVGELDGVTYREMRVRFGDFLKAWNRDAGSVRMPGGETVQEVQARAWPILQKAASACHDGAIVLVSHSFALQGLVCRAMDVPLTHFERVRHDIAAVTIFAVRDGEFILRCLNDRCHLHHDTEDWA